MDMFTLFLVVFLITYGASVFVAERVLVVISGIAALVAGIIGLVKLI